MSQPSSAAPISGPEAEAQLRYVERALKAGSEDERRAALADGLLAFGNRFVLVWMELSRMADGAEVFRQTAEDVQILFVSWLKGQDLTTRADERERRALAALQLLDGDEHFQHLAHYAAQAILALTESHPLRDVDRVRAAVRGQLLRYRGQRDEAPWVFAAYALGLAYEERFATDEELVAWEEWAEEIAAHLDPADALRLWDAIESYYLDRADRDGPQWRDRADRARSRIDPARLPEEDRALYSLTLVRRAVATDNQPQAADLLRRALDAGSLGPDVQQKVAVKEARIRLAQEQWDRVVALLEHRIDRYEEDYVTAILDDERREAGEEYGEACASLAFAYASQGRWVPALEVLERGKCARQRYMRAIRRTPGAAGLLELEADLYAISRRLPLDRATETVAQVEDWLAHGLSPAAQLQERYRRAIPTLDPAVWRAPRLSDIQGGLREGEAGLCLGLTWRGLLAALVAADRFACLHTILRHDVTEARLVEYLAGQEGSRDGFLVALERGTDPADQRRALGELLAFLDEVIGRPIADVLRRHNLRRLVVLPHRFLRLAPLWALPSWVELDVRMAPGAFSLAGETPAPELARNALLVANPTLDLPLAPTEAAITERRLKEASFDVRTLSGDGASEAAVAEGLRGAGLLHFAGHGHASLTDGTLSSLVVSPTWSDTPVAGPQAILTLAATPDAPGILIDQDEGSPRRKIYYEYAKRGTLFADALGDDVVLSGELWRAGDILVQGSLEGCVLAFLCACSSGLGAIEALDEASGLPAALDLAGVRSVVSTGWPVADALAVLFADEFYAGALGGVGGVIDVVARVRGIGRTLRTMERTEAADRVDALAARATDAASRFRLRAFAKRLRAGPDRPFADPFEWGTFFVTGAAEIRLARRESQAA